MTPLIIRAAAIALATLTFAATAYAQRSATRRPAASARKNTTTDRGKGLMLGANLIAAPGLTVSGEDLDGDVQTGFGPGAGLMIGYGFNDRYSAFASFDFSKVGYTGNGYDGEWALSHFEIGARTNLPYGSETNRPYLSGFVGRRSLSADRVYFPGEDRYYYMRLTGMMLGVGGGLQRAMSPSLTLDGGAELAYGRFGHFDADGESGSLNVKGTTNIRLRFGLTWRPSSQGST